MYGQIRRASAGTGCVTSLELIFWEGEGNFEIFTKFIRFVDQLNEHMGRFTAWLVLSMVLTTFVVAIFRYGFSLGC